MTQMSGQITFCRRQNDDGHNSHKNVQQKQNHLSSASIDRKYMNLSRKLRILLHPNQTNI